MVAMYNERMTVEERIESLERSILIIQEKIDGNIAERDALYDLFQSKMPMTKDDLTVDFLRGSDITKRHIIGHGGICQLLNKIGLLQSSIEQSDKFNNELKEELEQLKNNL